MHNSRLLQIIKVFDQKELSALAGFLELNFVKDKNHQEIINLFDLIIQYLDDLKAVQLKKEHAYTYVFPESDWNPGKFDKLLSRLLKAVQLFISLFFSSEYQSPNLTLSRFMQSRGLKSSFDRITNKWNKEINKHNHLNSNILLEKFFLKELLVDDQSKTINAKTKLELPDLLQSLDQYYIFTKLKYACQLLAIHIFVLPTDIEDSLKSFEHLDLLIQLPHLDIPVIQVYYRAYKMLSAAKESRDEHFKLFRELLDKHDKELSEDQQKSLRTLIRNYAMLQYHSGDQDYLRNAFEIYKDHLDKGYLYHDRKILAQPFRNIVTMGVRLEEFEWTFEFLTNHEKRIISSEAPGLIYNFNLALYHLAKKEYDTALDLLPDSFDDTYYKTAAKRMELMIYYETDSPILDAKVDAFKIFIYRIPKSKITEKQKDANNNFIHMLKQIMHPKTEFNAKRIEKLKDKITDTDHIPEKAWLLKILESMINSI